jgi:hypothetical protein
MKNFLKPILIVSLMVLVLVWADQSPAQLKKLYDPQKVVTIQGQIDKMETVTRLGRQAANGRKTLLAYLKTSQGNAIVHLGPAEFLARQQFSPKIGDTLEITGGRVNTRRGEVILAATVASGGKTYTLRDNRGIPVWSGQTPGCFGPDKREIPARS